MVSSSYRVSFRLKIYPMLDTARNFDRDDGFPRLLSLVAIIDRLMELADQELVQELGQIRTLTFWRLVHAWETREESCKKEITNVSGLKESDFKNWKSIKRGDIKIKKLHKFVCRVYLGRRISHHFSIEPLIHRCESYRYNLCNTNTERRKNRDQTRKDLFPID